MRAIDPAIEILPGTDVESAWHRFEVFEALHHSIQICSPMTSAHFDELVDVLSLSAGTRLLDVACGSGELLLRCAEAAPIEGVGIDLSPWMITRAHRLGRERIADAKLSWVLGEARDYTPPSTSHVAVCIGAEWVWHDFNGTARALAERIDPGGTVVIGAARLHHAADAEQVKRSRGHVETVDEQHRMLELHGLRPVHRIDPDDADWDTYLAATADAAQAWTEMHPGPRADRWCEEQVDWQQARERDREIIGWSVWIADTG